MRVTTNMMFKSGTVALQNKQQDLLRVQEQSLSGNRTNRPSDDPAGIFRHILFSRDLSGVQSLKRTTDFASQRLNVGEGHVNHIHERILQAQDLAMKLSSGHVDGNPQILKAASSEALTIYQDILKNVNSELDEVPLFGGGKTRPPFVEDLLGATKVRLQSAGEGPLEVVRQDVGREIVTAIGSATTNSILSQAIAATSVANDKRQAVEDAITAGVQSDANPSAMATAAVQVAEGGLSTTEALLIAKAALAADKAPVEGKVSAARDAAVAAIEPAFKALVDNAYPERAAAVVKAIGSSGGPATVVSNAVVAAGVADANRGQVETAITDGVGAGRSIEEVAMDAVEADPGHALTFSVARVIAAAAVAVDKETDPGAKVAAARAMAEKVSAPGPSDLPLSIRIAVRDWEYLVDINGVAQPPKRAVGVPPTLDLGHGITFATGTDPGKGDVFYFEVVPAYQGGRMDRPVQVHNGRTLPGNVTGSELLEGRRLGTGPGSEGFGHEINVLGTLAALRGALLRGDPTEVANQLDRIGKGRAQVSDFQAVTGIRTVQVDAVQETLELDESTLAAVKALNVEADLFDVLGRLEQASQAMQVMTIAERKVLDTSLIDFIR